MLKLIPITIFMLSLVAGVRAISMSKHEKGKSMFFLFWSGFLWITGGMFMLMLYFLIPHIMTVQ